MADDRTPADEETPQETPRGRGAAEPPRPPRRRRRGARPSRRGARRRGARGRGAAAEEPAAEARPRSPPPRSRRRGRRRGRRRPVAERRAEAAPRTPTTTRTRARSARQAGDPRRRPRGRHRPRGRRSAATARYERGRRRRADAGRGRRATSPTTSRSPRVTIDLAAGARYRATGKRKTAVARVILKPGHRRVHDQRPHARRVLPAHDAAAQHPPAARDGRLRDAHGRRRAHARRRRLRAGRRAAPRHLARAARGRPEPARRAQAPRLPDARPARQGAQEGRPQEGPQAAAVLASARRAGALARKLFGTDGVRGVAGELADRRARARARPRRHARESPTAERPRVLVIRDTRESGEMLEAALAAGVTAAGGDALLGGVLPTPARAAAARAATASTSRVVHLGLAQPLPRQRHQVLRRRRLQALRRDRGARSRRALERAAGAGRRASGRVRALHGALEDYLRALHERFADLDLTRPRRRCSTAPTAPPTAPRPEIFRRLGADGRPSLADAPDGRNINDGCGSTHVDALAAGGRAPAATTSASPSTATATACSPSTATARSSTATS